MAMERSHDYLLGFSYCGRERMVKGRLSGGARGADREAEGGCVARFAGAGAGGVGRSYTTTDLGYRLGILHARDARSLRKVIIPTCEGERKAIQRYLPNRWERLHKYTRRQLLPRLSLSLSSLAGLANEPLVLSTQQDKKTGKAFQRSRNNPHVSSESERRSSTYQIGRLILTLNKANPSRYDTLQIICRYDSVHAYISLLNLSDCP